MSELTDDIRRVFKEGDDIRDEGLTTPAGVIRHDDIAYGPDAAWQVMDLYLPDDAEGPLPVIVSVHGAPRLCRGELHVPSRAGVQVPLELGRRLPCVLVGT